MANLRLRSAATAGVLGALVALAVAPSAEAATKLRIDRIDGSGFVETSKIRVYFDLLDDEYRVIENLKSDDVQVVIDGQTVPGKVTLETFKDAKESVRLAVLMSAHRSYALQAEPIEGEEAEPDTWHYEKQGFSKMLTKLGDTDRVAVFLYHEKGNNTIVPFMDNPSKAAEEIEKKAGPPSPDDIKDITSPELYKAIDEVLEAMAEDIANSPEPQRRLLVVMSDGKDKLASRKKKAEKKIDALSSLAKDNGVQVLVVGYTLDDPAPLVYLGQLASQTDGIYREIDMMKASEDPAVIPDTIEQIAPELKKQYVMTFVPNEDYKGSEKTVAIRVEVKTPDGQSVEGERGDVKIGEKKFDWMVVVTWAGIVLGSLLGLFILFKIIGAVVRGRRNRPTEVYEEEEAEYTGPYQGKLACTEGPYAGQSFFLIDEVTTIGALDGNDIVLVAPGVSKRHAGVKIEDMRFELADFGSTNGTFVNGNKITKQFLRDGDLLGIGDCKLKFSLK